MNKRDRPLEYGDNSYTGRVWDGETGTKLNYQQDKEVKCSLCLHQSSWTGRQNFKKSMAKSVHEELLGEDSKDKEVYSSLQF